jgi:hypothetical protein
MVIEPNVTLAELVQRVRVELEYLEVFIVEAEDPAEGEPTAEDCLEAARMSLDRMLLL